MKVTKFPLMSRLLGLALSLTLIVTLVTLGALPRTQAAAKMLAVGITLPLTGADAEDAELIKDGAVLAIEEANAKGGVAGYKIEIIILDSGTDGRAVRPGAGGHEHQETGRERWGRGQYRPADERRG
jgi:hypothetical protein